MTQLFFFAVLALAASVRGQQCVFPFTYGSTTYYSCTTAASTGFWCSFDAVYSGNWKYCDEQECAFPFIYDGQTFTTCAPQPPSHVVNRTEMERTLFAKDIHPPSIATPLLRTPFSRARGMKFHPSLTANCIIMCGLFGENGDHPCLH
ncbi:uncharacterized protein LOC144862993 [Branchiostoma floridae x Branchiostoma japonicum]